MSNVLIFDKEGKFVREEEFKVAIRKKLIRRIVRILTFNNQGELFVQQRGPKVAICPNRWDTSVAGHVDSGETADEAAERETKEELGMTSKKFTKVSDYYEEELEDNVIVRRGFTTLYTTIYNGKINIDGKEVVGGRWVSLDILKKEMESNPKLFSPGFINAFRKYRKVCLKKPFDPENSSGEFSLPTFKK